MKVFFEVKATNGNNYLGGQDFDNEVCKLCIAQFKKQFDFDLTTNPRALRRLNQEVQKAKHFLSSSISTEISIPDLSNGKDFSFKLNRAKFEQANKKRFEDALIPVRDVFKSANITKDDIDEVILIGGSTRIPKVQELLQEEFGGKKLNTEVNPDEAVAIGAAIQGAILAPFQKDRILDDDINHVIYNPITKSIIQDDIQKGNTSGNKKEDTTKQEIKKEEKKRRRNSNNKSNFRKITKYNFN